MGSLTLGTVMSEATAMLGNRTDISQSRCSFYANQAAAYIWRVENHDLAEGIAVSSTTSGENRVTLPSDFEGLISISNLSSSPPTVLTAVNTDDVDSDWTFLGEPIRYALYSNYVQYWPSPDSSYSIQLRYRTKYATVSATTNVFSVGTRHDMAHLYLTAAYIADSVYDRENSAVFQQKFVSQMASMPSDLAMRQRSREGMRISMPHAQRGAQRLDSLTSLL